MINNGTQQMMLTILEHARSAKPFEFRLLTTWAEYGFYRSKLKTLKLIAKALRDSLNTIFKRYCQGIKSGSTDFNKLLVYQQIDQARNFYLSEIRTITDMLSEYEAYLAAGNFFWAFLGSTRSEEDMRDFRR